MKKIAALLLCNLIVFAADAPRRAPGFCLIDTKGQWQDLADYHGKPVVVEFMQTTCPHCIAFAGVLSSLSLKYGDRVAILSVALPPDTPQTMLKFADSRKLSYPLLLDQGQVAVSYVRTGTIEFPNIYLIDANGMIRNHWENNVLNKDVFEGNGLSREIDKLLVGAPARK
jgi:peroxiredoxin